MTCRQVSVEPKRTVGSRSACRRSRSTVVGPTGAEPAGRFQESRWWEARPGVGEERCHVFEGRATLLPEGGGPPVTIGAGDWVSFRKGFACEWIVEEPIAKRYGYFRPDGAEWEAT